MDEKIRISDLKVNAKIKVQYPQQKFSHDCYVVREINVDSILLESDNGDEWDGELIIFPKMELIYCKILKY